MFSAVAKFFRRERGEPANTAPAGGPGSSLEGGRIDTHEKAAELRGQRRFQKFDDLKHMPRSWRRASAALRRS